LPYGITQSYRPPDTSEHTLTSVNVKQYKIKIQN